MKTVVIFGGSGFVGSHIIRRLAKKGYKLIIPYQILPDLPKLRILGNVGQIIPIRFKNLEEEVIIKSIKNADAIINLKTIWDQENITYENGILKFNHKLIDIIKKNNTLTHYIFFSGLGVDESSLSQRIKIIAKSENYILSNFNNSIIVRPGIILGGNDNFLGRLIPIMKFSPFIPLFGGGDSNIQPVFIDDVAKALDLFDVFQATFGHCFGVSLDRCQWRSQLMDGRIKELSSHILSKFLLSDVADRPNVTRQFVCFCVADAGTSNPENWRFHSFDGRQTHFRNDGPRCQFGKQQLALRIKRFQSQNELHRFASKLVRVLLAQQGCHRWIGELDATFVVSNRDPLVQTVEDIIGLFLAHLGNSLSQLCF